MGCRARSLKKLFVRSWKPIKTVPSVIKRKFVWGFNDRFLLCYGCGFYYPAASSIFRDCSGRHADAPHWCQFPRAPMPTKPTSSRNWQRIYAARQGENDCCRSGGIDGPASARTCAIIQRRLLWGKVRLTHPGAAQQLGVVNRIPGRAPRHVGYGDGETLAHMTDQPRIETALVRSTTLARYHLRR